MNLRSLTSRISLLWIAIVAIVIGVFLLRPDTPEARAIKQYRKLEKAFENQSLIRLKLLLDSRFQVEGVGGVDEALAYCQMFYRQVETLKVSSRVTPRRVDANTVELEVVAQLSGTQSDRTRWRGLSESAPDLEFTMVVKQENGEWIPLRMIPDRQFRNALRAP